MQVKRPCWSIQALCQVTQTHITNCSVRSCMIKMQLWGLHILYIVCTTSHNDALCPVKHFSCLEHVCLRPDSRGDLHVHMSVSLTRKLTREVVQSQNSILQMCLKQLSRDKRIANTCHLVMSSNNYSNLQSLRPGNCNGSNAWLRVSAPQDLLSGVRRAYQSAKPIGLL